MTFAAPANASTAQAARNGPAAALAMTELCTEPVLPRSDRAGTAGCADAFASLRPVSAFLGDPVTAQGVARRDPTARMVWMFSCLLEGRGSQPSG